MPTFRYQSLGGPTSDTAVIDAPDRAAAVRALRQRGITPTRVEELGGRVEASAPSRPAPGAAAGPAEAARPLRPAGVGRMSRLEMATFIRELATASQAGLPLVPALRTILRQHRQPRQRAVIERVIHEVEHGRSLADTAAAIGRPFSELIVSMMRAGEMSGKLSQVLEQTADLLDRDIKTRRSILGALIYPAIIGLLIAGAFIIIATVIVPKLLTTFAKASVESLPVPTRIVLGATNFLTGYWWAIGTALLLLLFMWRAIYISPAGRLAVDGLLLRVPLLGRVLRDLAVARFTRTLGTLVGAGLPALTALRITQSTLGNKAMERDVERVCEQVAAGKTIADPLERGGRFPPLLTQIIGLGERSGRLPQMLNQAAGVFEDRTQSSINVFTAAFPPLLVVIAAVLVGFVIAAVMLPLIQMQELIG